MRHPGISARAQWKKLWGCCDQLAQRFESGSLAAVRGERIRVRRIGIRKSRSSREACVDASSGGSGSVVARPVKKSNVQSVKWTDGMITACAWW